MRDIGEIVKIRMLPRKEMTCFLRVLLLLHVEILKTNYCKLTIHEKMSFKLVSEKWESEKANRHDCWHGGKWLALMVILLTEVKILTINTCSLQYKGKTCVKLLASGKWDAREGKNIRLLARSEVKLPKANLAYHSGNINGKFLQVDSTGEHIHATAGVWNMRDDREG